jgi:hypothetical protein
MDWIHRRTAERAIAAVIENVRIAIFFILEISYLHVFAPLCC